MAHRYNQKFDEAYCKYCYKTHRLWQQFWDVFPDEVVWECEVCEHRTKDENMQIEKHAIDFIVADSYFFTKRCGQQ